MKEFITAAEDATRDPDDIDKGEPVLIDGIEYTIYRPTGDQLAGFMAETAGRWATDAEKTAASINFFFDLFEKDESEKLAKRFFDRNDKFGIEMLTQITHAMLEEWVGRPTKPSTGSTQSRSNGGRKSTARTRQSA